MTRHHSERAAAAEQMREIASTVQGLSMEDQAASTRRLAAIEARIAQLENTLIAVKSSLDTVSSDVKVANAKKHNANAKEYNLKCTNMTRLMWLHDPETNSPIAGFPTNVESIRWMEVAELDKLLRAVHANYHPIPYTTVEKKKRLVYFFKGLSCEESPKVDPEYEDETFI